MLVLGYSNFRISDFRCSHLKNHDFFFAFAGRVVGWVAGRCVDWSKSRSASPRATSSAASDWCFGGFVQRKTQLVMIGDRQELR